MSLPFEFQRDVSTALKDSASVCPTQVIQHESDQQSRRFNIYRNNRMVSLIENLKATYPAVCKLVGDEYFAAVAREYINRFPPISPVMAEYGDQLGTYIKQLPNTEQIPYIADIAALEWARLQAYHSQDAEVIRTDVLSAITPDEFDTLCFNPHPSLTLLSSRWAVGSLWSATQLVDTPSIDIDAAEEVVIVRPAHDVKVQVLPSSGGKLLDRLIQGDSLLAAVTFVSQQDPEFDPGTHLQGLIGLGAFTNTYKQG